MRRLRSAQVFLLICHASASTNTDVDNRGRAIRPPQPDFRQAGGASEDKQGVHRLSSAQGPLLGGNSVSGLQEESSHLCLRHRWPTEE